MYYGKMCIALLLAVGMLVPGGVRADVYPNDPLVQSQWWWESLRAPQAWETARGSKDVIVAVIDTGIDTDHPDLKDNMWVNPRETVNGIDDDNNGFVDDINGWDFVSDDNNPSPSAESRTEVEQLAFNHGTLMAGIIGAVGGNEQGSAGVNWNVSIMSLRALSEAGEGNSIAVNKAIEYAIDNGADVINLSLITDTLDRDFQLAISRAYHRGVLVVSSTGNDGTTASVLRGERFTQGFNLTFPACFDGESAYSFVLGVGAIDRNHHRTNFSNIGHCVDLVAPGKDIESTVVYEPKLLLSKLVSGPYQGTSLSAPFVSGAAALLKSLQPAWRPDELISTLQKTAQSIEHNNNGLNGQLGHGLLDIAAAVEYAASRQQRYPLHTLQQRGESTLWQAYDLSLKKQKEFVLPFARDAVVGWDVFDYDRDDEDELILVLKEERAGRVVVYDQNGRQERQWGVSGTVVGNVLISPLRPHDNASGWRPGVGLLFSGNRMMTVASYAADGTQQGYFETVIAGRRGVGHLDMRWSRRDELFVIAEFSNKQITVYEYEPNGNLYRSVVHELNLTRRDVPRRPAQFYFDDLDSFRDFKALYTLPAGTPSEIEIRSVANELYELKPFNPLFRGGVSFDVGDWDGDGHKEIAVATGPGSTPTVRVYNSRGKEEGRLVAGGAADSLGIEVRIAQYR